MLRLEQTMTNTELLTMIKNFRQDILERNRAVPKTIVLEQLHQLAMALVTGSVEVSPRVVEVSPEQTPEVATASRPGQDQSERSEASRNYSMLGVNYNRTLARFQALADQDSPEGKKLRASLDNQREKIDKSGAYSWEGDKPVYQRVGNRK